MLDYQGIRDTFITEDSYSQARDDVEYGFLMHGSIHWRVGGHMGSAGTSPYDPIFYSHHAMVDKLWDEWQSAHPDQAGNTGSISSNLQYDSFDMSVSDVLDNESDTMCVTYASLGSGTGGGGGGRRLGKKDRGTSNTNAKEEKAAKKAAKKGKRKKMNNSKSKDKHLRGSPTDRKMFNRNAFKSWLAISEENIVDHWADKQERGDIMNVANQIVTGMKERKRKGKNKRKKGKGKGRQDNDEPQVVRTCPLPDTEMDSEWLEQLKQRMLENNIDPEVVKKEMKTAHQVLEKTHAMQESRVHLELAKDTDLDFCFNVADFFEIDAIIATKEDTTADE